MVMATSVVVQNKYSYCLKIEKRMRCREYSIILLFDVSGDVFELLLHSVPLFTSTVKDLAKELIFNSIGLV